MQKHSYLIRFSHCLLLLFPLLAQGQTYVSGSINGTWTQQNSPYVVTGDITVNHDNTLMIEPGVQVLVEPYCSFFIYGKLVANGTSSDPIYFGPFGVDDWGGITFMTDSSIDCLLEYVYIEKPSFAIYANHCIPTIKHSTILAKYTAIKCYWADIILTDCLLSADTGVVECVNLLNSDAQISNCVILASNESTDTVTGIKAKYSNPEVRSSEVIVTGKGPSYGLWLEDAPKCSFYYDLIHVKSENQAFGIAIKHCSMPIFGNITIAVESNHFSDKCAIVWDNSYPYFGSCIVYGDGSSQGVVAEGGSEPEIWYSDVYNHTINTVGCSLGDGVISDDPLFVDPSGDFELTQHSPCINTGDPLNPPDPDGTRADMGCFYYDLSVVDVPTHISQPVEYSVLKAFPNPFNNSSNITFELDTDQVGSIVVYNQRGRLIEVLQTGEFVKGSHNLTWDASAMSSGIYYVQLETNYIAVAKQLILLK